MRKQFLLFALCILFGVTGYSQTQFGAGISYINDFGVQSRAKIGITEKINALPAVNYYFVSDLTVFGFDLVGSYDVANITEDLPIYAIGGLSLWRSSFSGESFTSKLLNLGAGTTINNNIYAELRLLLSLEDGGGSDLGINVGYYF